MADRPRVHGIPNCDTVKKARAWLGEHAVRYDWVDFRASPPSREDLSRWSRAAGWDRLLNRRGTTWRTLDREQQSLIKRPVVETGDEVVVGFDAVDYERRFG